jgi:hypothetical protein
MTPEHHAEAILRAAGSSLRHYEARTREAILAAVREAMEAERKAVVDWLRDDAIKTADEVRSLHARKKLTPLMSAEWDAMVQTKAGVAGAIERGEHLPTPPRGE